jgi:hypothetical protein
VKATGNSAPAMKRLVAICILFLVLSVTVKWRLETPDSSSDTASDKFSAPQAMLVLARILADQKPHPVDSRSNSDVRHRIVETLKGSGYQPEVHEATSCRRDQIYVCAKVKNIVATHGNISPRMIMLSAHYDSVAAGPGASDDGSGVSILLEVARLLKPVPANKNGMIFLFTDGEEAGLLGAQAFLKHPLVGHVAVAINAEARGTSGQSALFETGSASGWLVDAFAETSRRPLANSLISAAYKLLPNNTDLTMFKSVGVQGLNFAFGEESAFYHTPKDNLQSLNIGSLQQQGDNIYNLARTLQGSTIPETNATDDMVYTDVVGLGMVHWQANTGRFIAALLLLGFAVLSWCMRRTFGYSRAAALRGFLLLPISAALGGGVAYLLITVLGLINGKASPWHSDTEANRVLLWSSVLLAVMLLQRLLGRRSDCLGTWVGVSYGWLLLGVISAFWLPGVSYLFLLPSLAVAIAAILFLTLPRIKGRPLILFLLPALPAFALLLQAVFLVEIMTGFNAPLGTLSMGIFIGLASTFITPLLPSSHPSNFFRYGGVGLLVLVLGSAVASIHAAAYDIEQPQAVNIMYVQKQSGEAYLLATSSSPPAAVLRSMGPEAPVIHEFPELNDSFFAAPVASAALPAAGLTLLSEKAVAHGRQLVVRIDADAETQRVRILIPSAMALRSIETDGQRMDYSGNTSGFGSYKGFMCRGDSCNGRQLILTFDSVVSQPVVVEKFAPLVTTASHVVDVRNINAVQKQDGDQSVVINQVDL